MILDTNALSDLFKKAPGLEPLLRSADRLCIPVIVLGEYLFGLHVSYRAEELKNLLENFLAGVRVLPLTARTAVCYADIRRN